LTVVFAAMLFVPSIFKRTLNRKIAVVVNILFLALYAGGAVFLMNVAHQGGRLVHEFGVRAMISSSQSAPATKTTKPRDEEE